MMNEQQMTFGEPVGLDPIVPTRRHNDDQIECSDGSIISHGDLDQGGQGAVFKGKFDGKQSAIKVFFPGGDGRRLTRELHLLATIECEHLVRVFDNQVISISGQDCSIVAYEFYPGGDLTQHLTLTATPLQPEIIAKIGFCVSTAYEALWQKRIVHRDIKPANIVEKSSDEFILVDVGLARHLDLSDITAPGGAPGTPSYKSPEQARGRRSLTVHTDTFSLGVTLYELAAKQHPFSRNQSLIGATSPRPLSKVRPDLPRPLSTLIHQMMSTIPADRPSNVSNRFESLLGK